MLDQYRLCILPFLQRFSGNQLHFNVLILPQIGTQWNGNPLEELPLGFPDAATTGAAFADASLAFEARIIDGLEQFPAQSLAHDVFSLGAPAVAADARALFTEMQAQFQIKNSVVAADLAEAPKKEIFIKKYLTKSYRNSFNFTRPRVPEAVTDDSYHCAIKEDKPKNPAFQPTPDEVTWGKVYAYCLRHPLLARRLGLIREMSVTLTPGQLENGGFLYVTLATGSAYVLNPGSDDPFNFIRHYATRIPALEAGVSRPLFTPVLFPVLYGAVAPVGSYDQIFIEASEYDDGFAKIVHANQPISQNLLAEEDDGFAPLIDLVRLGWDDESVLERLNRQLREDPDQPGSGNRLDAPTGIFAYRIDVREEGEANWHSLTGVQSKAPLQLGPVNLGTYAGELGVEVHPMQLDGDQATGQYWLPSYFAAWKGESLVLPDEAAAALYKTEQDNNQAVLLGRLYNPTGLENVDLRYGRIYDFRVRLMDTTGGGPAAADEPVHEAPAPTGTLHFKRYVRPEPLIFAELSAFVQEPTDDFFPEDSVTVRRPLLGYPSVVYTGKYADPIPLLQAASDAALGSDSFGIPDPDVVRVQVDVEVRTLKLDNKLSISGREPYIHLYTTYRDFPADFDAELEMPLAFRDAAVLNFGDPADLGDLNTTEAELLTLSELILPTGRDIRITVRGMGEEDPSYYGGAETHIGKPTQFMVRRESAVETDLLAELSVSRQIRGIYLQPDPPPANDGRIETLLLRRTTQQTPSIIQRLADQLDVDHKGLTLVGEKGQRVVFGCSRSIQHTLAPDHSSITFASKDDLLNHWIVAIVMQVDRDWTWDMLQEVSFEIFREKKYQSDDEVDNNGGRSVGDLEMKKMVSINALDNPDRSKTTLIFLDAVEPKSAKPQEGDPAETAFPDIIELNYRLESRFQSMPDTEDEPRQLELILPVTTRPAQVPKIVSAGIALSKYVRDEQYAATEARERYLWLELDEPVLDPNDSVFIRFLGYAPDPLLSDNRLETYVPPEEPALNIDPELIRVITPGMSDDRAGLAAMQSMEKATDSDRHYLVPLPAGLHAESNELFGFFTYELRIGHDKIWSTAQGRFGRPRRTTGVQHPAPTLFCTCHRDEVELLVEAPYAMAVLNGKNLTANPPRTELWALLYAQVRQADGKDYRNILLGEFLLRLIPRRKMRRQTETGEIVLVKVNEDAPARAVFHLSNAEINYRLATLGLPLDSPLSVVCVEMMPTLASFRRQSGTSTVAAVQTTTTGLMSSVRSVQGNTEAAGAAAAVDEAGLRPLSDHLGHFRMLRTSPLTPVPDVCCTDC